MSSCERHTLYALLWSEWQSLGSGLEQYKEGLARETKYERRRKYDR